MVLLFGSLIFPISIILFIEFIILALLSLFLFPTLNLVLIMLLVFSDGHQSCHCFNHCGNSILDSYVSHKNHCCRKVYAQQCKVLNVPLSEREAYMLI